MAEFGFINTNNWQPILTPPAIKTFINTDEPQVLHIVESGWEHPKQYCVIIEDGEFCTTTLELLGKTQIKEKFNVDI